MSWLSRIYNFELYTPGDKYVITQEVIILIPYSDLERANEVDRPNHTKTIIKVYLHRKKIKNLPQVQQRVILPIPGLPYTKDFIRQITHKVRMNASPELSMLSLDHFISILNPMEL